MVVRWSDDLRADHCRLESLRRIVDLKFEESKQ